MRLSDRHPVTGTEARPALVVLDTNVVLDWLVFEDPRCAALHRGLLQRRLRWIATSAMRDELAHVLARHGFAAWQPDLSRVWALWDEHCNAVPAPEPRQTAGGYPRCSDPDDQKFIDLAIASSAHWLLSRDRAVLKLRQRLRSLGTQVATPECSEIAADTD